MVAERPKARFVPPSQRGRTGEGEQTRQLLLDVAEELFAEYGPDAVSIRSINAAAGLAPAAVHYHFGSKDALIQGVLTRRGVPVWRRHEELLTELESSRSAVAARDIVEALANPLIELVEADPVGGLRWIRLAARLNQTRDPNFTSVRPVGLNERFQRLVCDAYPATPEQEARLRWSIAGNALLRQLADADSPVAHQTGQGVSTIAPMYIDALIDFTASGVDGLRDRRRPRKTGQRDRVRSAK